MYSGNLFTSEMLVGREEGSFSEKLVNVWGIPTQHLRGFCTVFAFSWEAQVCISMLWRRKGKILNLLWHLDQKRYKTQGLARIKYLKCTCKGKSHAKQIELVLVTCREICCLSYICLYIINSSTFVCLMSWNKENFVALSASEVADKQVSRYKSPCSLSDIKVTVVKTK